MNKLRLFQKFDAKKVFRTACTRYDLVYFGQVSQHSDDHSMVRGFTLSPRHVDRHYCVGTVADKDIILLERSDTISSPDKPSQHYTWLVMKIDLLGTTPSHIILNGHEYDAITYDYLRIKYPTLQHFNDQYLQGYDPEFIKQFRVYAPLHEIDHLHRLLSAETTAILSHHFSQFDFEIISDELLIYLPTLKPRMEDIESMLKAGLWFADILNAQLTPAPHI